MSPRLSSRLFVVPLLVGGAFAFLSTRFGVGDSDVFWHLATARDFLSRGLGRGDTFSWTAAGRPVATDQWLGQLLLLMSYEGGGWPGIVALRAIAVGALAGLTVLLALDARPGRPLAAVLVALPALFLERFVSAERPELLGFVCFAILVVLLRRGQRGGDRAFVACVPLIGIWANLHGSFALGVALLTLVALERAVADPDRRGLCLAVIAAGFAATLATPAGVGVWTAPGLHFVQPPRFIQEWAVPDLRSLPGALFGATLAGVLLVAFLRRSAGGREDAILLVPLLFVSLTAQRQLPYFAIAAVPFLAGGLPLPIPRGPATPRAFAPVAALIAAVLVGLGVGTGPTAPDLRGYPAGALAALPPGPGLLAEYDWGGYLIAAAPATPVFVDGRLVPYIDPSLGPILDDYVAIIGAKPGWREVIRRRGVHALLVRSGDPVVARAADLGWPVRARGDSFVLVAVP